MAYSIISKLYPRACETRPPLSHPSLRSERPKFFGAIALNLVLLQLLFLVLFCYLFGSLFQQGSRTHSLKVLWVDYDGGIVGDAVRDAYNSLQSDSFPTLIERPISEFPSESDLKAAVCSTTYWAALYTSPQSSESLGLAISGSSASQYNQSDILTYIWNEARYPTALDGSIAGNIQTLSDVARVAYIAQNGTSAFSTIPPGNSVAISAFANPWTLSSVNIQPTTQGTRAVYNTIVVVLILIQDFFYLGTVNGLYAQFRVFTRISPVRIIVVRNIISGTFTMIGGLLISATIWAFKSGWNVSGNQFALNWLALWLFGHVNFLTLDLFTIWIPAQYVPMALITWVVMNVTSIMLPFDLSSPFYRWAYALPAHATYEVLTDIWSRGCNPHLDFALPILFAYELSGLLWTSLGVYRRSHFAVIAEEAGQEAMRLRVETALKLERERDKRLAQENRGKGSGTDGIMEDSSNEKVMSISQESPEDIEKDRKEAEKEIEGLGSEIERMETRATLMANFGPSFHVAVGERE